MIIEKQIKNLSITIVTLTILTLIALIYYYYGFNRTLDPVKSDHFSLRVNTDQDHGGKSKGKLIRTESGSLLLTCEISHSYKYPFCEMSFDYKPKPGGAAHLDLSIYDEVAFNVVYSGDSKPTARFIIRNFNHLYSEPGDLQSDKFNVFEFDTTVHNPQSPLALDYLYVPKWWFDYYQHPVTLTAVDISHVVSIEIGTEELVTDGESVFEIHSIEFRGKWLPLAEYQQIIITVWIVTLFSYLVFYLMATHRQLKDEKENIQSLRRHLEKLQTEVSKDPLTGLRNRRGLEGLFHAIEMLVKHKHKVSLAVIDIDHFKSINDTYGHDIGDDVLRQFSQLLLDSTDERDLLIRWGGEEFVVILVGQSIDEAKSFFHHLLSALKSQPWPKGIPLTASIGAVALGEERVENAITRADALLYQAKKNGRDQIITH